MQARLLNHKKTVQNGQKKARIKSTNKPRKSIKLLRFKTPLNYNQQLPKQNTGSSFNLTLKSGSNFFAQVRIGRLKTCFPASPSAPRLCAQLCPRYSISRTPTPTFLDTRNQISFPFEFRFKSSCTPLLSALRVRLAAGLSSAHGRAASSLTGKLQRRGTGSGRSGSGRENMGTGKWR